MIKTENFKQLIIENHLELREWLLHNHLQNESIWLVTFKKNVAVKYVSREAVLDELLCFGWIDGIRRALNDEQTMQLISKRKSQHWAKSYKDRVARLMDEDRMHSSGLKAIEESKKQGLWNFMDDVDQLIIPDDLQNALSDKPEAQSFFNSINDSSKRFVLRWIKLAKTEKTRSKRIQKIVELSAQGKKLPGS